MSTAYPELHVGDHVTDREGDAAPLLVVGKSVKQADEYYVEGMRVADYNPSYPDDDAVVEAVYPKRADVSLDTDEAYAFPRSRLRLVEPIHAVGTIEAGIGEGRD